MSALPRLEVIIPPVPTVPQESNFSSGGEPLPESPSSTLVFSPCSTPSTVDTLIENFVELKNVEPNLSTLHLLAIHIGSGTFLLFLFSY